MSMLVVKGRPRGSALPLLPSLLLFALLLAALCPQGTQASGPGIPSPITFVSESEFEAACERYGLRTASFALDADLLQRSDEFYQQDSSYFSQGAFLGSTLNLRPERTALPVGIQLRRTQYNAYVGFLFRKSQQAGAAPNAGTLQLNSDPTDDDITISFYTRVYHTATNYQLMYAVGLTLQGDLNTAEESISVFTPYGTPIVQIAGEALRGGKAGGGNSAADSAGGAGPSTGGFFVGVLSPKPIGFVLFDESNEDHDVVTLERMHVATADANLMEELPSAVEGAFWLAFNIFIIIMLIMDMQTGRRQVVMLAEAIMWSLVWIGLALVFAGFVFSFRGRGPAIVWLTAYILEKVLSVDNLFVFLTIFASFHTPVRLQHKVLTWGILGAIVLRAVFIFTGVLLVEKFSWLLAVFGGFLLYTGGKAMYDTCTGHDDHGLSFESDASKDVLPTVENAALDTRKLSDSFTLRLIGSVVPLTRDYDPNGSFFIKDGDPLPLPLPDESGILYRAFCALRRVLGYPVLLAARASGLEGMRATPLLAVLIIVETTDMVFAADSIPAVLSITQDPFIAYTSNIFAILGLRALYFALAAAMTEFVYLAPALGIILTFIGAKLLLVMVGYHVSVEVTLTIVLVVLAGAVILSLLKGRKGKHAMR